MIAKLSRLPIIASLWLCVAQAESTQKPVPAERISVYQVPLVCPAAPQIGCGSHAKPILLAFEREAPVASAWLNRQGTLMAIVWQPATGRKQRVAILKSVTEREGLAAREPHGAERKKALADFPSDPEWLQRERGGSLERRRG